MSLVQPRVLAVVAAPFLASCVFLLDYDDLQGGPAASAGAPASLAGAPADGGVGNAAGGVGGEGGNPSPCADCDDQDACTIDICDETGDTPVCTHQATEGLKVDGFETILTAPRHMRVSLVAGGQQFYLATLEVDGTRPKVGLYRLGGHGKLESFGAELALEGVPVSNAGLAVEELALGEVALHGFVATRLSTAGATPKVFHFVNEGGKTTVDLAGLSYADADELVFPQALAMGDRVVGAWIQSDGTIAVHDVDSAETDTFGLTTLPATTLALLSTGDARPAILFTAQPSEGHALGTYVETSGQNRTKLPECETRPGYYRSSSVIGTQIPGLWLANVTRYGDGYVTTGGGHILCGNNVCVPAGENCANATPSNGVRNLAGATVRFETDPPGIIYSVLAIPQVDRLSLALGRADFSTQVPTSTAIGGDESGLMTIAPSDNDKSAGPDWPAVAILPTKQVAVAWIQMNPKRDGTELHVQRYKMCLP